MNSCPSVVVGNLLHYRTVAILWVLTCLGVFWIVEQPQTSVMKFLDIWQQFAKDIQIFELFVYMGDHMPRIYIYIYTYMEIQLPYLYL